jgi:hypothetical protein
MDIDAEVQTLIDSITSRSGDDPRSELAAASSTSQDLTEVGDRVLAHFVAQARRSGQSWQQIGDVLAVSKQAAQKRFGSEPGQPAAVGGLFARFDSHLAQACMTAVSRAGEEGSPEVTAGHLLFGVAAVGSAHGAAILAALGYQADEPGEATRGRKVLRRRSKSLPFAPDARAVFERLGALVEKRGLAQVGTEHLLLALATGAASTTAQGLARQGITAATIEDAISGHLLDPTSADPTVPDPALPDPSQHE